VDKDEELGEIASALIEIQKETPLIFPVHPRSRKQLENNGLIEVLEKEKIQVLEPLGYLEFLSLMTKAKVVLTDSGGIQEETTVLGVPCLTVRNNTERPITVIMGTNRLIGNKKEKILANFREITNQPVKVKRPEFWDGESSQRIAKILADKLAI
jgi:UDP-N-acetylglucosamine 2-epimerase (non-hydrolysing)